MTAVAPPVKLSGHALELGHIVLYVSELERSVVFYRDILGWPVLPQLAEYPIAMFSTGTTHHDLLLIEVGPTARPIPSGPRVGMYHFGVKVGDSDDDLRAVLSRIEIRPDLARLMGAVDAGYVHSLYVLDPDGNEVELYVDIPGWDWKKDPVVLVNTPRKRLRL